jgi:PAS domain S-box-containing protein
MVLAGLVLAGLAADVARRRQVPSGLSLAVMLLAVAWWGFAYAIELSSSDLAMKSLWGDLKYAGVATLAPAWLVFVLLYTGRGHLVSRPVLLALAIEPIAVMAVLLNPGTHDLVRSYPESAAREQLPVVETGLLFWVHFGYVNAMVLVATVVFVASLVRVSRVYWRPASLLVAAALLPWTVNALHNFEVGPLARIDLTPFAFLVTGGVLVWGLFRERLVDLTPVARSVVVESMTDAVLVLDAFRHVADVNPAAVAVLGGTRAELLGRPLSAVLPGHPAVAPPESRVDGDTADAELSLLVDGVIRYFDARRQPLHDRTGSTAGELVVLRDVTDRRNVETRLREVLAERTRVADALQASLLPATLPHVPGVTLAGRYQPAGTGHEIGGDFFDIFRVGQAAWGVVLGDVSGKGAEAAAMTALVRYTLRTLAADQSSPRLVLSGLNEALLRQAGERFCTVAYAVAEPSPGSLRLIVCLGGHHPPLVLRADGTVGPIGRIGTAIGLLDDAELHDDVVELSAGDLVCLFTDGLVEARKDRELFGEERVRHVLAGQLGSAPNVVAAALEEAALQFRGRPLSDDLALLLLQVDPLGAAAARPAEPAGWTAH